MDYIDLVSFRRHDSWEDFLAYRAANPQEYGRLVLMTTKGSVPYTDFEFQPNDVLLMGRESSGVPESVHEAVDARIVIPMKSGARSINVAISCAMATGEALRQINHIV